MRATNENTLYVASDMFMLRAPVLQARTLENLGDVAADHVALPGAAPPGDTLSQRRAEGRKALLALAGRPRVRHALQVASPDLSRDIERMEGRADREGKKSDRAFSALLRYLTRMSTRPTPHGLFAGVAAGVFTGRTYVVLHDDPVRLTRTRADSAWLYAVVKELEDDEKARDQLPVRVNDLAYQAGRNVVLFRQDAQPGRAGHRVEIRLSRSVEAALELARAGPTFGELVAGLAGRFPAVSREKIRTLLGQLWDLGILQSCLRPPLTDPRPERYLLEQLTRLEVGPAVALGLQETIRLADEVDHDKGAAATGKLEALSAHQLAMVPTFVGSTYRQDTALAATAELSRDIASTAADTAETLMRLGCVQARAHHIAEYHHRFLEHYGTGAELPLLDVLSSETGLGPPNDYHAPPRQTPWPSGAVEPTPERDRTLAEIASYAAVQGLREVQLSDDWFEDLCVWSPDDRRRPARTSLDLYVQLAAETPDAVAEGRWRIIAGGAFAYSGGQHSFGRHCHYLDGTVATRLRNHSRAEENLRPDTVFAELNYYPAGWRGANVAMRPAVRRYEINVNTEPTLPPDRQIPLADILVGADPGSFYLRSARLGKRLSVGQVHALSPATAPNVCRALLEFSADGFTQGATFDWGHLSEAPFLPRLTRGRTVVHRAAWTITKRTFADATASPDEFFHACQLWRRTWKVPRYVYLTEFDNRLLLDLEHPLWVDELHREIKRRRRDAWSRRVTLQEALPGPRDLWVRDSAGRAYHSEFTVPLRLREPHHAAALPAGRPAAVVRRRLPGDEWIHLKVYSAPDQHDPVIAGPLRAFVRELRDTGLIDQWFFIRYADPMPHLRLRFHASNAGSVADVMSRCAMWGRGLLDAGLAVDTAFASYVREVERYGGPYAIDTLETVFFRNSEVSADLVRLSLTHPAGFDMDILCIAAIHDLYESWGPSAPEVFARDSEPSVPHSIRERFRELRRLLCDILAPGGYQPDPRATEYRAALQPILGQQRDAVRAACGHVRRLSARGLLAGSEGNILESLTHIQAIRLLGVDRNREVRCRDLRAMALRAIRGRPHRRHTSATPGEDNLA